MERRHIEQLETIRSYWNTRADGYSKSVMEEMEDAQKEGISSSCHFVVGLEDAVGQISSKGGQSQSAGSWMRTGFFYNDAWPEGLSDDRI